jgi:hypothetical protein
LRIFATHSLPFRREKATSQILTAAELIQPNPNPPSIFLSLFFTFS